MSFDLQMKRKIPTQLNGTASQAGEPEKDEEHESGPELQRTGMWVLTTVTDLLLKQGDVTHSNNL